MTSKSRLAFIDLLRGWALLVMIEVHVFNAFLLPYFQATSWFNMLNFINGLVAPSFIFISGFVFLLASQKKLESFRTFGPAFWKQLGRIGLMDCRLLSSSSFFFLPPFYHRFNGSPITEFLSIGCLALHSIWFASVILTKIAYTE